jgi:hypothetical protein
VPTTPAASRTTPHPQGSTWAVRRRNYFIHDPNPPTLTATVAPRDIPHLRPAQRYAVWSDQLQVSRQGAALG